MADSTISFAENMVEKTKKPPIDFHHIMNQIDSLDTNGVEMKRFIDSLDEEQKENFSREQALFRLCIVYFFSLSSEKRKEIAEAITPFNLKHTMSSQLLFFTATVKYPFYTGDILLSDEQVATVLREFYALMKKSAATYSRFKRDDTE